MTKVLLLASFLTIISLTGIVSWHSPTTHDFGDILRGEAATHHFYFTNTSSEPIVIQNVRTSCGCTTSDWAEKTILPDSVGVLTVTYDALSTGYFRKYVKVYFSGQRRAEKLWLEGFVENNG